MSETNSSSTLLYGVFGDPISHSLSPIMHNAAFKHFHQDAVYLAFRVQEDYLGLAFEGVRAMGIRGVNLTLPLKERAVDFVDEIPEDLDRRIGALNTVVQRDGKLFGYNTDALGFLTALKEELSFKPEGKTVLVLGAGGASRGVSFALAYAHTERLFIHNRTQERALGLADHLAESFPSSSIEPVMDLSALRDEKIDLVVNATSCGLKPSDPAPFDLRQLQGQPAVYDLVYSRSETALGRAAKKMNWPYADGLGMLVNQGALAFELWTGIHEDVRSVMAGSLHSCLK